MLREIVTTDSLANARRLARTRAVLANMTKKKDVMRGITIWRDRTMPAFVNSRSWIGVYLVQSDEGRVVPRLVIYYVSDDWLFISRYLFRIDGVSYSLEPDSYGPDAVERDNGSGDIWEWWDVEAEDQRLDVLKALANAKQATIRYEGQHYYHDRTIGAMERAAIGRTLQAYEALQEEGSMGASR